VDITVDRYRLYEAVRSLRPIIRLDKDEPRRSHVVLEHWPGELRVAATDGDLSCVRWVPTPSPAPTAVETLWVPWQELQRQLAAIRYQGDTVRLQTVRTEIEHLLVLSGVDGRYVLTLPLRQPRHKGEDLATPVVAYPAFPVDRPPAAVLPGKALGAALRALLPFVAPDLARPALATVRLDIRPSAIQAVAADGFALHWRQVAVWPWGEQGDATLTPPAEAVTCYLPYRLVRWLSSATARRELTGNVSIWVNADSVQLRYGAGPPQFATAAQRQDVQFPRFDHIIPAVDAFTPSVRVDVAQLASAVRRLAESESLRRETVQNPIVVQAAQGRLVLQTALGSELAWEAETVGTMTYAINAYYLLAAVTASGWRGTVCLAQVADQSLEPVHVRMDGRSQEAWLCVIMPIVLGTRDETHTARLERIRQAVAEAPAVPAA